MSLTLKAIAYVIVALALIAVPHAVVPSGAAPEASRPLTKEDWSRADLVCEIEGDVWAVDIDTKEPQKVLLIKNATNPSVRPGTRDIAFVRGADIWLWSADTGKEQKLAGGVLASPEADSEPEIIGRLSWHPEGRWIAFSTWQRITWQPSNPLPNACRYYDPGYGPKYVLFDYAEETNEPAKAPDLSAPRESPFECVRLLDTKSHVCYDLVGPDVDTESGVMLGASAPAWRPDGTSIAYVRGGDVWELGGVRLPESDRRNAKWGNRRVKALGDWFCVGQGTSPWSTGADEVCYTLDGEALICLVRRLAGSGYSEIEVIELARSQEERQGRIDPWLADVLAGLDVDLGCLTVSPDGSQVAYETRSGFMDGIRAHEHTSVEPRMVAKGGRCPSWIDKSE